jgi:hypothetical protein
MATIAVSSAKVAVAYSGELGRSAVYSIEELLERKISASSLESREYGRIGIRHTMWHPISAKVGTNFANKQWSLSIGHSFCSLITMMNTVWRKVNNKKTALLVMKILTWNLQSERKRCFSSALRQIFKDLDY